MAQKNFDIDRALADEFQAFCKKRGMTMGTAASAALLAYTRSSADQREQMNLDLAKWLDKNGEEQGTSKPRMAAKKAGGSRGTPRK
ncbi:hypothetical protein [Poriferisphaera sp. WC338]|uniref:hypothetical protein n=1 Tax=Poriferisphaera sp. WC338 TaxID=3425129 RepID=UPI003D814C9F